MAGMEPSRDISETQGAAPGDAAAGLGGGEDARSSAAETPADGLPAHERHLVLGIMMAGTTAACISQSMMIAALPTVMHEFAVSASLGQLLTTAYIFTLGLFSAMSAYLVSRVDAKALFLVSMAGFSLGCAASIVAPNYPLLLAARLVQAIGAGIALPLIQVVAMSVYPKSQYGRAMGIVGVIIGFAPAIGPAISGVIIDVWGWRAVFVSLGTIAAAVIVLAVPLLPNVVRRPPTHAPLDAASAVLFIAGFSLVMVAAALMEESGALALAAAAGVLGAACLFVFVRRQLRIPNPLLKLSCFFDRTFTAAALLVMLSHIAFMSASIMVPMFVQDVQGGSATVSGLVILPGAVLLGFLNPVTGRYLDKHGARPLIFAGCALLIVGSLAFVPCDADTPAWAITAIYGLRTVGIACLMMPMTAYACKGLSAEDMPQGNAILTSLRQIFGSLSSSVLITVFAVASGGAALTSFGFGVSFLAVTGVIAVVFVVALVVLPKSAR